MHEKESKKELLSALQDVVAGQLAKTGAEHETEVAADAVTASRPARRRRALVVATILLWGTLAAIWIARPAFIFDPDGLEQTLTADESEAVARYALYLQRARVDEFVRDSGRLPATLEAAGDVEEGVTYHPMVGGFVLEYGTMRLVDRMDADSFLGDALRRLPKRAGQ